MNFWERNYKTGEREGALTNAGAWAAAVISLASVAGLYIFIQWFRVQ